MLIKQYIGEIYSFLHVSKSSHLKLYIWTRSDGLTEAQKTQPRHDTTRNYLVLSQPDQMYRAMLAPRSRSMCDISRYYWSS